MDHPAPLSRTEPWRAAALVAAGVAALELVALIALAAIVLAKPFAAEVRTAPESPRAEDKAPATAAEKPAAAEVEKPATEQAAVPGLERDETAVLVLNGNGRSGAAGEAAESVRRFSYLIAGVGNAPRTDFSRSLVMFRPEIGRAHV